MKYALISTSKFKKDYKRIKKRNLSISKLTDVLEILSNGNKLDFNYYNHRLSGEYKGCFECHISSDWLLIYFVNEESKTITLLRTGSHSDLF